MTGEAEALIEMRRLGDSVRVSAVCPVTGLEATIVGPAAAGEAAIEAISASAAATLPASAAIRPMNNLRSMPSWVNRS